MRKIFCLAFMLLSVISSITACNGDNMAGDDDERDATELLKKGDFAPDFTVGGKVGKISNLKGKYVVIDFWASWCPDCRKETPKMKELYENYASDRVVFVGVSFDKTAEALEKYLSENEVKWVQTCEYKPWKETKISKDYHIKWIPTMYVINPDGKVELATVMIEKLEKILKKISEE